MCLSAFKNKSLEVFKLINTSPIKARVKFKKFAGMAELNKNNIGEIKDFAVCLSKSREENEILIFQINYEEKINSHPNNNNEKVLFVDEGTTLKKEKLPKKVVLEKLYLFCRKSQKYFYLKISMIVVIRIFSIALALVVYWIRRDIHVSLIMLIIVE